MDEKENRNYINTKIHPIFEKLVIDLLLNKPDEPVFLSFYSIFQR